MKRQEWQYAQAFNPNIVVIKLGTNDSKPQNWKHGKDFAIDLQKMIDTLKDLPAQPTIFLATPVKAYENRYGINDTIISNEIIPIINKVAKKNKIKVIDLHEQIYDKELLNSDGVHPNAKGAEKMANIIATEIMSVKP